MRVEEFQLIYKFIKILLNFKLSPKFSKITTI